MTNSIHFSYRSNIFENYVKAVTGGTASGTVGTADGKTKEISGNGTEKSEFLSAVNAAKKSAEADTSVKRSGHIAESLKEHPDWRVDVERQIHAGEKLKKAYPPSKPVEEMTLDEYKSYIWDMIGKIPLDPSHYKDDMTINISEEGFLTMKDDPEYESWLLGHNYMNLTFHNPWASFPQWTGTYGVDNFGASIEEHHGGSWSKSVPGAEKKYHDEKGEGFWERRARRAKEILKEQEKKAILNKEKQKLEMQQVAEMRRLYQKMLMQYFNEMSYGMFMPVKAGVQTPLPALIMTNIFQK